MNEVYSTHGWDQKYIWNVSQKSDGLRSLGMGGNIILQLILDWAGGGGDDCIYLAQVRVQWLVAVNTVGNLRDLQMLENISFLLALRSNAS